MSQYRRMPYYLIPIYLCLIFTTIAQAEILHKPYILAEETAGDVALVLEQTKKKLQSAGFELVGEYSPYSDTTIIIVTNEILKKNAADSNFGAFGAGQRITVSKVNDKVQLAFTNPVYMANAYRMKSDLSGIAASLKNTLGFKKEFGSEDGLSAKDLRGYHYKWLMPYFDDRIKLTSYSDYDTALKKVESALQSNNKSAAKKVYRIDLTGKQETVIGVSLAGPKSFECSGDKYIMDRIDFKNTRSSGHLPYEVVISGNTIYTLPAEFRIAISFPDLSMIGRNSFASIMCAPDAISSALTLGVGGQISNDEF